MYFSLLDGRPGSGPNAETFTIPPSLNAYLGGLPKSSTSLQLVLLHVDIVFTTESTNLQRYPASANFKYTDI
jgi:hypothetical protein